MKDVNETILISSWQGEYPVSFYKTIKDATQNIQINQDTFFIIDEEIWSIYSHELTFVDKAKLLVLASNEETKTLQGSVGIIEWLNLHHANKSSTIIAIGGGVIQDVTTFVSHIYYRGIRWHFFPTTLLSQSDSCIGAKCGINVLSNKNQVGVLHSPSAVYIVEEFLGSLIKSEFESGYGEIFKLAITGESEFFDFLREELAIFGLDPKNVISLIRRSLISKKRIIEEDEYEKDLRRILNYGHSFGHSLESLSNNKVTHGYAILFGMDLMNYLGRLWGITPVEFEKEYRQLIIKYFPDMTIGPIDAEKLVEGLRKDKKVLNGKINFAIVEEVGKIILVEREIDELLVIEVKKYLNEVGLFSTS